MSKSSLPEIIFHYIENPCNWPAELAHTTERLSQPLRVGKPDRNGLSPHAAKMYEEILKSMASLNTDEEEDNEDSPRKWLTGMLDTILTIVHLLQSYTSRITDQPQSTRFLWTSLFASLGIACSKTSFVMTDTPFLWPSTIAESQNSIHDGRASFLISAYIAPERIEAEYVDDDRSEGNISTSGYEPNTSRSVSSLLSLDGPADGHILPGSGRRVDCVLPVICVADESNIHALVVSTVYQRYAWGIDLPVVAISIEDSGLLAKIVIGWINVADMVVGSELPQVHLASSSGSTVDSRLGVFDLSDPLSALQLSQFILGLRYQFDILATHRHHEQREICWRLDHLHTCRPGDPHTWLFSDLNSRTQEWLNGIASCDSDPVQPLELSKDPVAYLCRIIETYGVNYRKPPSSSNSESSDSEDSEEETSDSNISSRCSVTDSNDESSKSEDSEETSDSSISSSSSATNFAALKDTLDVKTPPRSRASTMALMSSCQSFASHYSVSSFAKIETPLLNLQPGIERWLWERSTIRVGCIKLNRLRNMAEVQLNEMIDHYTRVFELAWPTSWPTNISNTATTTDIMYQPLLDVLFAQYQRYLIDYAGPVPALAEDVFSVLTSRFSMFLSSIAFARRIHYHVSDDGLKEGNVRDPFELLLSLFWSDIKETIPRSYFWDHDVQLASNKAVEGGLWDNDQAFLCDNIAWDQLSSLDSAAPAGLRKEMRRRSKDIENFKIYSLHLQCPRKLAASQRSEEPTHGLVDGLGITRVVFDSGCGSAPTEVHLPCLVVKYQDMNSQHKTSAFRQCQMACISAVEFLSSVGVVEFPIFGLVVSGSRVSIMMAYHSTKPMDLSMEPEIDSNVSGFNILMDENLVCLDITEPLDALRFVSAIHRIFLSGRELQELVKDKDLKVIQEQEKLFFCSAS
ncbi:hypothetical protein BDN70DRAFT_876080 [Pholiota conissans]|uniref:Uncharacterized protein n=1 Tax=Pholiota conissans TaxID=109636 RepID=A0A9P6CVD3_9AGAR|nr:hypothetical protein BDN70DRAFT_876080 [Pholiota conissans]